MRFCCPFFPIFSAAAHLFNLLEGVTIITKTEFRILENSILQMISIEFGESPSSDKADDCIQFIRQKIQQHKIKIEGEDVPVAETIYPSLLVATPAKVARTVKMFGDKSKKKEKEEVGNTHEEQDAETESTAITI